MLNENKYTAVVICLRISLILICLIGLVICAFVYPFQVSITAIGVPTDPVEPTVAELVAFWVQLLFYWLASIPCFITLLIGWGISSEIKRGLLFSMKIARRLNTSALILFVDCLIYLVAQFVFTMLGWNPFVPILLTIGLIGLILSFALYFAARYVGEAAKIKAENEEYI